MTEKTYSTKSGVIHYWVNSIQPDQPTLVFLPGLTADHRLFQPQLDYFEKNTNVFVWDAPAHGASWPFLFDFSLTDEAEWLGQILLQENIQHPIIVGQSMGGYVGQVFAQIHPDRLKGFVSVDSAPLQRSYVTALELWMLKRVGLVYKCYPWKALLKAGSKGVAVTPYGQKLMYTMMKTYDGDKARYVKIAAYGYQILAQAYEKDLPYKIPCPALLLCGEKDRAGSCIRYSRAWHKNTGIPLHWVPNAGHNSNTDQPERVNRWIETLLQ